MDSGEANDIKFYKRKAEHRWIIKIFNFPFSSKKKKNSHFRQLHKKNFLFLCFFVQFYEVFATAL